MDINKIANLILEDDSDIIKQAQEGSEQAFKQLNDNYRDVVYRHILKMVRNEEDASDLTQETFAKAFSAIDRYQDLGTFLTYLLKIATNSSIDYIRKRKIDTTSINKGDEDSGTSLDPSASEPDALQSIVNKSHSEIISKALQSLPDRYRKIAIMRFVDEKDYNSIAQTLGLPLGTVKIQIARAKELLQNKLRGKLESRFLEADTHWVGTTIRYNDSIGVVEHQELIDGGTKLYVKMADPKEGFKTILVSDNSETPTDDQKVSFWLEADGEIWHPFISKEK